MPPRADCSCDQPPALEHALIRAFPSANACAGAGAGQPGAGHQGGPAGAASGHSLRRCAHGTAQCSARAGGAARGGLDCMAGRAGAVAVGRALHAAIRRAATLQPWPLPDITRHTSLFSPPAGQLLELPASVLPRTADVWPILDCVLLGVGPDGHIASLFPNRKETAATGACPLLPLMRGRDGATEAVAAPLLECRCWGWRAADDSSRAAQLLHTCHSAQPSIRRRLGAALPPTRCRCASSFPSCFLCSAPHLQRAGCCLSPTLPSRPQSASPSACR